MIKLKKEHINIILPFILFLILLLRLNYFYNLNENQLIGIVPDDAFYYLKMAQNKAFIGIWSFDGLNTSTGFHLLYGYLLYFIYSIFGNVDWKNIFLIISLIASIFISISCYLVANTSSKLFKINASILSMSFFFSTLIILQNTLLMESWLVIFFASATIYLINNTNNLNIKNIFLLICCGLFGSLSRTDYGILPGIFFIVHLCFYKFNNKLKIKIIFYILAGAVLGVGINLFSNFLISGNLFQSSAQIKFYWSSVIGHNIEPTLNIIFLLFKPFNFIILIIFFIISILTIIWKVYKKNSKKIIVIDNNKDALTSTISCLFVIISYIIFYRLNSQAIQIWYISNLIVPISILTTGVGFYIYKSNIHIVGIVFLLIFTKDLKENFTFIQWPHQSGMLHAARQLALEPKSSKDIYAAWNAGIYGYFSNKLVINIDGLTNDEILIYIKNNKLNSYLKLKNINKIIDYEIMINNRDLQLRGGYLDDKFIKCLEFYKDVNGNFELFGNTRIIIFNIDYNCQKNVN